MTHTPEGITGKHRLEYGLVRGVECLLARLPLTMVETLGRMLGSLVWGIYPVRFEVVATNLSAMFPELDVRETYRLAHRIYRHHGSVLATYLLLSRSDIRDRILSTTIIGNEGYIQEALNLGRGEILTGIHFGHWEAYCAWLCLRGYPLSAIYRVQKNPLMDRLFIERRLRFNGEMRHLTKSGTGRFVKELKANRILVVAMDQRAGKKGTSVRFMNRIVRSPKGAAFLHLRTGAPILWSAPTVRNGHFFLEIGAFDIPRYPAITEENLNAVTQIIMSQYETMIRKNPEQWFWFHKLMPKREYPRRIRRSWRDVAATFLGASTREAR